MPSLETARNHDQSDSSGTTDSVAAKCWREAELLGHGVIVGGLTTGSAQVAEHPLELMAGLLGSSALGLALKGPAWVKMPALGLAAIGNAAYGLHVIDCVRQAAPAFASAWQSDKYMDSNFALADKSVGSLAFDGALMGLSGWGTAKLADRFPAHPTQFKGTLSNQFRGLSESFNLLSGHQPELALAGAGRSSCPAFEAVMPEAIGPKPISATGEPIMMAATGTGTGGGGSRDFNYRFRTEGSRKIHEFENVRTGGAGSNEMSLKNAVTAKFGYTGNVEVKFPDGHSRALALGKPIDRVKIVEHPGQLTHYHFNGSAEPDLISSSDSHYLRGRTNTGYSHLFDTDCDEPVETKFSGRVLVGKDGYIYMRFPDGQLRALSMGKSINRVALNETKTGATEIKFDGFDKREMVTDTRAHLISAMLPKGRKLHIFDRDDRPFETPDGLKTSFSQDGRIGFLLPNKKTKFVDMGADINQIMLMEGPTGIKTFVTYAEAGNPATRNPYALTVPPLSEQTYWHSTTPAFAPIRPGAPPPPEPRRVPFNDPRSRWLRPPPEPEPRTHTTWQNTSGPVGPILQGSSHDLFPSMEDSSADRYPGWRLGIPHSIERGIMDTALGIDSRALPFDDLNRMSTLGIVMQEHNWVVENYLAGLDHHHDF